MVNRIPLSADYRQRLNPLPPTRREARLDVLVQFHFQGDKDAGDHGPVTDYERQLQQLPVREPALQFAGVVSAIGMKAADRVDVTDDGPVEGVLPRGGANDGDRRPQLVRDPGDEFHLLLRQTLRSL